MISHSDLVQMDFCDGVLVPPGECEGAYVSAASMQSRLSVNVLAVSGWLLVALCLYDAHAV